MSFWSTGSVRRALGLVVALWVCGGAGATGEPSASASAPSAASTSQVPVEHFFRLPQVLRSALSPDGTQLAITTGRGGPRVGLVVFDLLGNKPPRRVAQFSDIDIGSVRWLGNDQLIFNVIDLEAGSGVDQREAPGLYAVNADGQELRSLIQRLNPLIRESAPLARRTLAWNHVLLSVPLVLGKGVSPDEIVVGEMRRLSDRVEHIQPLWLNVRTLRTRSMDFEPPPDGVTGWLFDSGGQARAAWGTRDGRRRLWWRDPAQAGWKLLADHDALRAPFTPRFVDDAGQLFVTRAEGPQGLSVLTRYDFERKAPAPEPWVKVDGFDFAGSLVPGLPGEPARGVRVMAEVETTVWLDAAMKQLQQRVDERLPGRINRLSCRRCSGDDAVVLVESAADRDPGQLLIFRPARDQWQRVAAVQEGIDPAAMARVDFERIRARDGRELPVWLTLPPGHVAGRPAPAVVMVHGGPWVRGGYWRWQPMEQFLASRGYVVISPDYRGSTGYGDAHFRAGWKQWGQAMQDDIADALLWARGKGLVDDSRACIAGASYGGYATLMGLVRHPQLYRCGIAWVAVTDPLLYLKGSWWVRDDISEDGRRYSLPEMVGDAERDAEMLKAVSPVEQAARIGAPLLLAFGDRDLRVPVEHGERLRDALRKAGREPQWVVYPGEAHGWRKPENQLDWARRVEAFLARHLGAGTSPSPPR